MGFGFMEIGAGTGEPFSIIGLKLKSLFCQFCQGGNLWRFGAYIAIARLARKFGDEAIEKEAVANAAKYFADGLDYAATEKTSLKYFNRLKEQHHNVLRSTNFMLMNLTPEVGRYLRDHLKEAVVTKNEAIKKELSALVVYCAAL